MGGEAAAKTKTPEELAAEQKAAVAAAAEAKKKADDEAAAAAGGNAEGEEGFDVIEEGATPASDRVIPLSAHIKAKVKWKQQKTALKGDAEAKGQEAELLKLQLQQKDEEIARLKVPKGPPKRADFADDESFEQATQKHHDARVKALVAETVREHVPAVDARASEPENDADLDEHYKRAEKLKAPDFDAMEDEVINAIGKDAARAIVKQYPNSEAVVYALGKNPQRLAELVKDLKSDPVRAIVNLTQYAAKLQLKPRGKAPDPDSANDLKGSGGGSDPQKQLDRLRELRQQGKATTDDILKFKKDCRAKGIKLKD